MNQVLKNSNKTRHRRIRTWNDISKIDDDDEYFDIV